MRKPSGRPVGEADGAVRSAFHSLRGQAKAEGRKYKKKRGAAGASFGSENPGILQSPGKDPESIFGSSSIGEIVGTLLTVLGFLIGTFVGIALAVLLIVQFVLDGLPALMIPVGILLLFFILLMFAGFKGHSITSRIKRFRNYCRILNDREFCDIEELVEGTGKSKNYVVKDVQEMIKRRMFRQGHLDKQHTCLIVTEAAYQQYVQAQKGLEAREAQAKAEKEKMNDPKYSEEVRSMLIEGDKYVKNIRACNDAIQDVEISAKISRLELIVSRIFSQVEKDPSFAPELHQFMNYYLPTTQKLLNVYEELDHQPVQGQNISDTKKEIEATLDTINQAFENLLDSCYKDTAWDVSTDISVLNTMLAKEGLTGDSLHSARKGK